MHVTLYITVLVCPFVGQSICNHFLVFGIFRQLELNGDQSPSINRDRDRGDRESVGYRLGHCTFAYREESIMGAKKKLTQDF